MDNLESIAGQLRAGLTAKDEAREKILPLCREAIRYCGNAIRAVHRREFELGVELLQTARGLIGEATQVLEQNPELGTGLVRDAQKEYAEASVTLALVTAQPLPEPAAIGVEAAPYLNGLGEAVGEMRRYLLDDMRRGDLSRGEELLGVMDGIYGVLVTMDFPDAISGGLRRTTDMVRGVLERTRSDLTVTMRQKQLEDTIAGIRPGKNPPGVKTGQEAETGADEEREEIEELTADEITIYDALYEWRSHKSSEENLAPNIIARNSWLKEIIKLRPATLRDLVNIKGFGERRANKYGKEIIAIIKRFK